MEKVVLVISTGRQDIKIWAEYSDNEGNKKKLVAPLDWGIRDFHIKMRDALRADNSNIFYTIDNKNTPDYIVAKGEGTFDFKDEAVVIGKKIRGNKYVIDGVTPLDRPNPPYRLYPAKIGSLVKVLKQRVESKNIEILGVVLFATERERHETENKFLIAEPIAAGEVLGHWIVQELGNELKYVGEKTFDAESKCCWFNFKEKEVCWINMLKGVPDYSGTGRDFPIQRKAARIIDDALEGLSTMANGSLCIVSDTGGIAQLKSFMRTSAALRFRNHVIDLPDTETQPLDLDTEKLLIETQLANSQESLQARNHCEQRLWQGDFLGAWGVVAHLQDSPNDEKWINVVRAVADFFRGAQIDTKELPEELTSVTSVIDHDWKDVLRSAFKVEAALQGQSENDRRLPEAILNTVNFFDVVFRIEANRYIENNLNDHLNFIGDKMDGLVKLNNLSLDESYKSNSLFSQKNSNGKYHISIGRGGDNCWITVLHDNKKGIIKEFSERLNETKGSNFNKSLRSYRNYVAHRALTHEQANDAIRIAAYSSEDINPLWNVPNPEPSYNIADTGNHFLSVRLITEVFKLFDISNATQLYQEMLQTLISEVRGSICYKNSDTTDK